MIDLTSPIKNVLSNITTPANTIDQPKTDAKTKPTLRSVTPTRAPSRSATPKRQSVHATPASSARSILSDINKNRSQLEHPKRTSQTRAGTPKLNRARRSAKIVAPFMVRVDFLAHQEKKASYVIPLTGMGVIFDEAIQRARSRYQNEFQNEVGHCRVLLQSVIIILQPNILTIDDENGRLLDPATKIDRTKQEKARLTVHIN